MLRADRIKRVHISPASPWQNGVAEHWIGSCRRELLDHLIVLNDVHLRRLIRDYISIITQTESTTLSRKTHR
jgi:hypothetical protein